MRGYLYDFSKMWKDSNGNKLSDYYIVGRELPSEETLNEMYQGKIVVMKGFSKVFGIVKAVILNTTDRQTTYVKFKVYWISGKEKGVAKLYFPYQIGLLDNYVKAMTAEIDKVNELTRKIMEL